MSVQFPSKAYRSISMKPNMYPSDIKQGAQRVRV